MAKSRIRSNARLSAAEYWRNGRPNWWAEVGIGESTATIRLPDVHGDKYLDVEVDLPAGTRVSIGTGHGFGMLQLITRTVKTG